MGSRVKVLKNRNLPLRHLPCLPRQFGFWKKLVESEILFGETRRQGSYRGDEFLFVRRGIPTTKPHLPCLLWTAIINVLWFQWGIQSHQTKRFSRIFDVSSLYIHFWIWFLFGLCSMFAQFRKSKVTFEEQNLNIYNILVLILLVTPL